MSGKWTYGGAVVVNLNKQKPRTDLLSCRGYGWVGLHWETTCIALYEVLSGVAMLVRHYELLTENITDFPFHFSQQFCSFV